MSLTHRDQKIHLDGGEEMLDSINMGIARPAKEARVKKREPVVLEKALVKEFGRELENIVYNSQSILLEVINLLIKSEQMAQK